MTIHEEEKTTEKGKHQLRVTIRPYQGIIAAVLIIVIVGLLAYFFFAHVGGFVTQLGAVMNALQAVLIGILIAYILCPVVNFFERKIKGELEKKSKHPEKIPKRSRALSILVTFLLVVGVITLLLRIVIPQVAESVAQLVRVLPDYVDTLEGWLNDLSSQDNVFASRLQTLLDDSVVKLTDYLDKDLPAKLGETMLSVTASLISFGKTLFNIIIGFIVAIYLIADKDRFRAQAKKMVFVVLQPKAANKVIEVAAQTHEIFIGFIFGKVIDSVIMGILSYIVLSIFAIPYALLVSVIVGVTNVIPFFGPFIGAIPSFLLILVANPIKALVFLVIILVLQQIDGNIIGPKILGQSTGLSTFWVIVAILFGSGMYGFMGMLLGVPVFASIANILRQIIDYRLKKDDLPTETENYLDASSIDIETHQLVYAKPEEKAPQTWKIRAFRSKKKN